MLILGLFHEIWLFGVRTHVLNPKSVLTVFLANYCTLDIITGLTFGESLKLLSHHANRWFVPAFFNGNWYMYHRMAWPNLFNSGIARIINLSSWLFPTMDKEGFEADQIAAYYKNIRFNQDDKALERLDLVATMRSAREKNTKTAYPDQEIWDEALLLIRAGGDTTSAALAAFFFYLSRNTACYVTLASEVRSKFQSVEEIEWGTDLMSCHYLRACIDEAMRLSPPAPGAFWREVSPGGASIDGESIPAGCEVGVGSYALGHNQVYFPDPFAFRPERFIGAASAIIPKGAFAPFSLGPRVCPAKALAYRELSLICATVIWQTDFRSVSTLGEGREGWHWGRHRKDEYQIFDLFSANKFGPELEFRPRKVDRRGSVKSFTV